MRESLFIFLFLKTSPKQFAVKVLVVSINDDLVPASENAVSSLPLPFCVNQIPLSPLHVKFENVQYF